MLTRSIHIFLLFISTFVGAQSAEHWKVIPGDLDKNGFPMSSARACMANTTSANSCYTPPRQTPLPPFGLNPRIQIVGKLDGKSLTSFTAESSAGGSGSLTLIALLQERDGIIENLLPHVAVTNQSEYKYWRLPTISALPVLVTADFVWARDETHFARHHYRIRAYVLETNSKRYIQATEFVTSKKYPGLDDADAIDILGPERQNLIARLNGNN